MATGKKKTLNDVAAACNVSVATASRILNGNYLAADLTQKKVWQAAKAVGYVPKSHLSTRARQRFGVGGANSNISILVQSYVGDMMKTDAYYVRLYLSAMDEARKADRHLNVLKTSERDDERLPKLLANMSVGGVIATSIWDEELLKRIQKTVPMVLLNSCPDAVCASSVMPNETSGIFKAMDHLRDLGHRKIFFFKLEQEKHGVSPLWHDHERERAYRNYVGRHKEDMPAARCEILLWDGKRSVRDLVREALDRWVKTGDMPTAVVCAGDVYALPLIDAAHDLGIDIPGQMSLIGADDTSPCEFVRPRLTSIRQPFETMGSVAAKILFQKMDKVKVPIVKQLFDVSLVHRDSCAPPPTM